MLEQRLTQCDIEGVDNTDAARGLSIFGAPDANYDRRIDRHTTLMEIVDHTPPDDLKGRNIVGQGPQFCKFS
ncbi:MAG TPA: hypothetical protein VEY94_08475 [Patescibacteria group bacterium]|nr:hypothetical protein [Patescibacteria group bacterium]